MPEMNGNPWDKTLDGDPKRARRASEGSLAVPDPEVAVNTGRRHRSAPAQQWVGKRRTAQNISSERATIG